MSVEYESRKVIDRLKKSAEETTGEGYATLTEAHQALKNGYGKSDTPTNPYVDTRMFTNLSGFFASNQHLSTLPYFDTSNVTKFTSVFQDSDKITEFPNLNFKKGTDFGYAFQGCQFTTANLEINKPQFINQAFQNCKKLETVNIIIANADIFTSLGGAFNGCTSLREVTFSGTPKVANFSQSFNGCTNLVTINGLDMSSMTSCNSTFSNCKALENLNIINGIRIFNNSFSLGSCSLLTAESLHNVVSLLFSANKSTRYQITLPKGAIDKLSDEDKLHAENENIALVEAS